ncbi:hypothetical protein [Sphingomonas melonis]|uniref:Uncharacterized protein n=1 Tax=Sphingomonas melonis TaxID=152682 RepID=A0A7Y9FKL3_9SPHN|nr:hypothetical protein [Sphingomonas melonis]NYD89034.1 hypothetical protein [Sphingomonas melonis]
MLRPQGPFFDRSRLVWKTLIAFRTHDGLRPSLCHGVAGIAIERNGKWIAMIRQTAIRNRKAKRSMVVVEQTEASTMLSELKRSTARLAVALTKLRDDLGIEDLG